MIEARSETLGADLGVVYPWAARVAKLEGYAQARFGSFDDGRPRDVEIVDASHPLFARSLRRSLRRVRPGARRESPPTGSRQIRIEFALRP